MTPQSIFVGVVAICLLNGLVSPVLPIVWHLHPVWRPEMLPATREIVFYGASLIVSTGTLLIAAVPAALAERLGLSLMGAMWTWLGSAAVLLFLAVR